MRKRKGKRGEKKEKRRKEGKKGEKKARGGFFSLNSRPCSKDSLATAIASEASEKIIGF